MNNKGSVLFYVRTALTLCLIAGLVAALLAGVNEFTKDKIENAKNAERKAAIEQIFGEADITEFCIDEGDECIDALYKVERGKEIIGYAALCSPAGYGGKEIELIVGLNEDKTVKKVLVIADNQTAGIGDKVAEESWLSRYEGADKDSAPEDTIAGATKSSSAVNRAVASVLSLDFTEKEASGK